MTNKGGDRFVARLLAKTGRKGFHKNTNTATSGTQPSCLLDTDPASSAGQALRRCGKEGFVTTASYGVTGFVIRKQLFWGRYLVHEAKQLYHSLDRHD